MTVTAYNGPVTFATNGSVQDFAFTFSIGETEDIVVTMIDDATGTETVLVETTDYVVSATNDDYSSGGSVYTNDIWATGYTVQIHRDTAITQESEFIENMPTLYETFENALDKITRILQELDYGLLHEVHRISPSSSASSSQSPSSSVSPSASVSPS